MKENKQRSLEWLKNLDASAIIDIDIDMDPEQNLQKLLVENTRSSPDSKLKHQLDQIHQKLPKSLPKQVQSKPSLSISNLSDLPRFLALFKEIKVTSPENFDWIKQIEPQIETLGIIEACQGIFSNIPSRSIYSALVYWVYEGGQENEWLPTLQSIYLMFATGHCDYFYVTFKKYYSLFIKESGKSIVYISNPNSSLINQLKKNLVNIPDPDIENVLKLKSKKPELLRIEGKSVHAFYNFLANSPSDCSIISPSVFLNGQFKFLSNKENEKFNTQFEIPHIQYRVTFQGPITRSNIQKLCKVLTATQNTFTMDLVSESQTRMMPGEVPSKIVKKASELYDIYFN
jgi:hypothetical protein